MNTTDINTTPNQPTPSDPTGPRRTSKKGAVLGLTAGLVGGSLAGMVFGVPGLSNAAADGASDTAVAAVVRQADDPVDTPVGGETTDARPEPGERLRELLQGLVDDGTLTAEQADAVATHLVENRPERGERGDRGRGGLGGFERSGVLTDLLGIDAHELREQLRSGSTLAEIAAANGVETSALIDALVTQAGVRVDAAVEAGKLTAEEGAAKLAEIETRITDKINGD